jgi:D-alanine-D-alanine ligase-like ATP-grasp enzyme
VLSEVGADFRADMRAAADALGVRLASVEVIASDVKRSLADAEAVIVEVNTTPGLHYHYRAPAPRPVSDSLGQEDDTGQGGGRCNSVPVAVPILRRLLRTSDA